MLKSQIKKFVLGTAQFGDKPYGISTYNSIEKKKILKILNFAWKAGISIFDTAESYKCYDILKIFIKKKKINDRIKIITKVPSIKKKNFQKHLIITINKALKHLNIKNLHCLLFHDENDIITVIKNKKKLFKILKKFKIKNFGFSLYSKKKMILATNNFKSISVQFPYNILNNNLTNIKKRKNIFYARSIFLQGLLTEKKIKLKNNTLLKAHKNYNQFLLKKNYSGFKLALNYVFNNKNINYFVIGVQNLEQLKKILNCNIDKVNHSHNIVYNYTKKIFKNLNTDPRYWHD